MYTNYILKIQYIRNTSHHGYFSKECVLKMFSDRNVNRLHYTSVEFQCSKYSRIKQETTATKTA